MFVFSATVVLLDKHLDKLDEITVYSLTITLLTNCNCGLCNIPILNVETVFMNKSTNESNLSYSVLSHKTTDYIKALCTFIWRRINSVRSSNIKLLRGDHNAVVTW